ncbi:phage portal protein [Bosea sp. (in: a-proteobacteria)]|uniref:phage portal protein n=1 Tax=Bosea sp. (in: a-proteobacteria) TaxID=1871050 RepID=UPI003B3B2809
MNAPVLVAADGVTPLASSFYRASETRSQALANWLPPGASADKAILRERRLIADRAEDLARNNPVAIAAITRLVDMIVGAGLRFSSKPSAAALGITREAAADLGKQIERELARHLNDPRKRVDAQRKLSGNGLWRLMARSFVKLNEACVIATWREKQGPYETCFLPVDPERLCNPTGLRDGDALRGGVVIDSFGAPVAYQVRNRHPGDGAGLTAASWERVPRETSWGRPVFLHVFEPEREDQNRPISPFAALMPILRMKGTLSELELAAAAVNAMYATYIKSNMSFAEVAASLEPQEFNSATTSYSDQRTGFYEAAPVKIGGVRVPVLPPGDEIAMAGQARQSAAMGEFDDVFNDQIAARLGMSRQQVLMNFAKLNYSSSRTVLNETWRMVRRLVAQFCEQGPIPMALCIVEEAIDKGYIRPPPGCRPLWDEPAGWLSGRWIGPGRGWVDPVKEAEAAALRMETMVSTLEMECAEQGFDYEEILDQIEREEGELKARNLSRATVAARIVARSNAASPDPEPAAADGAAA